jgi:hypothetical protein
MKHKNNFNYYLSRHQSGAGKIVSCQNKQSLAKKLYQKLLRNSGLEILPSQNILISS